MSPATHGWTFHETPADFLAVAGELLAADPIQNTVVTTIAERAVERGQSAADVDFDYFFAAHADPAGRVDAATMRTAEFAPHPLWLLPMDDAAARSLAGALLERGTARAGEPFGVNGALPAARVCAEALAGELGGSVEVHHHTRLFRLDAVAWPARPAGRLRRAVPADLDLCVDWIGRFHADADAQAGRAADPDRENLGRDEVAWRIGAGKFWLFETPEGVPVHLSGVNDPSYGVARIGPVFTPAEHRGRGYAAWTVARLSADVLEAGAVPCLFTDQANPVSNQVYERIGYTPVADTVELRVAASLTP